MGYYFFDYWIGAYYFVVVLVFFNEKFLNWSNPYLLFAITATGVPIFIWEESSDIFAT